MNSGTKPFTQPRARAAGRAAQAAPDRTRGASVAQRKEAAPHVPAVRHTPPAPPVYRPQPPPRVLQPKSAVPGPPAQPTPVRASPPPRASQAARGTIQRARDDNKSASNNAAYANGMFAGNTRDDLAEATRRTGGVVGHASDGPNSGMNRATEDSLSAMAEALRDIKQERRDEHKEAIAAVMAEKSAAKVQARVDRVRVVEETVLHNLAHAINNDEIACRDRYAKNVIAEYCGTYGAHKKLRGQAAILYTKSKEDPLIWEDVLAYVKRFVG